ncbi:MAG: hypothetical protein ACRCWJ_16415 [Casimicrobium sp.]
MPVETAFYFAQLNANAPTNSDFKFEGDDQLRLIKGVLQTQFPSLGLNPVNASALELSTLAGISTGSTLATQLALLAPKASPALTGIPTAPTPLDSDDSTRIATTEFVQNIAATIIASSLPVQTGNQGRVLTTNGTSASWSSTLSRAATGISLFGFQNPNIANADEAQIAAFTGKANVNTLVRAINTSSGGISEISAGSACTALVLSLAGGASAQLNAVTGNFEASNGLTSLANFVGFALPDYFLSVSAGNPFINWDVNDFTRFTRSTNVFDWTIGGTQRMTLEADGKVFASSGLGVLTELGFRDVPRRTAFDANARGCCVAVSAGFTVNTGVFSAGNAVSIYNDSASSITITQGGGMTLRIAGTATTGSRTLAPRSICTIWFNSGTEGVFSGAGLS